jgi:hypothetical protein
LPISPRSLLAGDLIFTGTPEGTGAGQVRGANERGVRPTGNHNRRRPGRDLGGRADVIVVEVGEHDAFHVLGPTAERGCTSTSAIVLLIFRASSAGTSMFAQGSWISAHSP